MSRDNLDIAMLITDAILNEFEKNGKCNIPLDESKDSKPYSWDLQDVIQEELEKIAEGYLNKRVKIKGQEIYGKVIFEYSSEVVVAIEVSNETLDNTIYFKKSEVEIVDEESVRLIKERNKYGGN